MTIGSARVTSSPDAQSTGTPVLTRAEKPRHDLPADRYLEREESWLRFNQRVLELAEDPAVPLLERVRFMAIFASNLDEFFMVRVAGLVRRMAAGLPVEGHAGRRPTQVLENVLEIAGELTLRHAARYISTIQPDIVHSTSVSDASWKTSDFSDPARPDRPAERIKTTSL